MTMSATMIIRMRLRRLIGRLRPIRISRVTFPPSSGAAAATPSSVPVPWPVSVEPLQEPCHQAVDPERPDPCAGEEADEDEDRQRPEPLVRPVARRHAEKGRHEEHHPDLGEECEIPDCLGRGSWATVHRARNYTRGHRRPETFDPGLARAHGQGVTTVVKSCAGRGSRSRSGTPPGRRGSSSRRTRPFGPDRSVPLRSQR